MNRRSLLKKTGTAGLLGSSIVAGCLERSEPDDLDVIEYRWRTEDTDEIVDVAADTVITWEHADAYDEDDSIVGLDAENGERQWSHTPGAGGMDPYSDLTVNDGIYFTICTDTDCLSLNALDTDGEVRWTREIYAGHDGPTVIDDTVYVVSFRKPVVRALDAESGSTRWYQNPEVSDYAFLIDVDDVIYAEIGDFLYGFDLADGSRRWQYELSHYDVEISVSDGIAYVRTGDRFTAVDDGEEKWHWEFEESAGSNDAHVIGVTSDTVLLRRETDTHGHRIHSFDSSTGERNWMSTIAGPDVDNSPGAASIEGVVYIGGKQLRALDAVDGSEMWSREVEYGSISSVTGIEHSAVGDHALIGHSNENWLTILDSNGDRILGGYVDGELQNFLVDESLFVHTDNGLFMMDAW